MSASGEQPTGEQPTGEQPTGEEPTAAKPIETTVEAEDSAPAPEAKSAPDRHSLGRFLQELPYDTLFELSIRTGNAAFQHRALVTSVSLFSPNFIEQAMVSSLNVSELSRLCRAASLPSSGTAQELAILLIASLPADRKRQRSHLERHLSALKRPSLIRLARTIGVDSMSTQALLEGLTQLPEGTLSDALSRTLSRPELRDLCLKRGLSTSGSKTDLADRLTRSPFSGFGILQYERLLVFIKILHEKNRQKLVAACGVRLPRSIELTDDADIAEALVITPVSIFEEELGRNLHLRDLVEASKQLGLSTAGRKSDMAGRIVAWLSEEQPKSKSRFRSFEDAREFARKLALKGRRQWFAFCRGDLPQLGSRPSDIPTHPDVAYAEQGWINWNDWLGTRHRSDFRPFDQAREFARGLGLKTVREWEAYCRSDLPHLGDKPEDIPSAPWYSYRGRGWEDWGDWLGTGTVASRKRSFRPFEQAREFARTLKLRSSDQWRMYRRGEMPEFGPFPEDIPAAPEVVYRDQGWKGYSDFLGTRLRRRFRSFEEARAFVRSLGLTCCREWYSFCRGEYPHLGRRPRDIPADPANVYANEGWQGFPDFLGKKPKD